MHLILFAISMILLSNHTCRFRGPEIYCKRLKLNELPELQDARRFKSGTGDLNNEIFRFICGPDEVRSQQYLVYSL